MYYIGIDLGGTNIAAGIVDENLNLILKDKLPTNANRGADEIVEDMTKLCRSLVAQAGLTFEEIAYLGVAVPGAFNPVTGVVKCCNNVNMHEYPIADKLKAILPIQRVCLDNDANAAALAEAKIGAGKGADDFIMITLGTGVGGGIVIGGKLYSGFNCFGGELGHVTIEFNGRECSCGRKGCWEAYSSATALVKMTKEAMQDCSNTLMWALCENRMENVTARTAFDAAKKEDPAGKKVVKQFIEYLACGLVNMINIFQPRVLCIGGGLCGEGDYLLNPLKEIIERDQYGADAHGSEDKTVVRIAQLGNDAGIIGAALLGI